MSALQNMMFQQRDVFDEDGAQESGQSRKVRSVVHIRVQQRNGKKSITTVQGLADDLDLPKILKALKKSFNTNGTILNDEEFGEIIKLQGDQRKAIAEFFCTYHICEPSEIKIHGF
jgi:translation initiation factor 1